MFFFGSLGLSVALLATAPLAIGVTPVRGALEIQLHLEEPLPETFTDALPSGAVVRVIYPLRVRRSRTLMWDGRVWKGEITSRVAFDPLVGRYQCELLLDEVIVTSAEVDSAKDAVSWLTTPPPVRLGLKDIRKLTRLYVRARAVFSVSTTLLVFPDTEGTDWVSVSVVPDASSNSPTTPVSSPTPDSG
ncbi:MAG: DUF4390 domain-containing protein [Thermoanaerobaculales bacterium]|nr:DUF4390 domain-containing protein [Thermoanaerobaculales bacterium]